MLLGALNAMDQTFLDGFLAKVEHLHISQVA